MTIRPKYEAQAKPSKAEEQDAYELVTFRDRNTCQRCLRVCGWGVISRDHRKDRSVGGLTTLANLQILGGTGTTGCHGWKTQHPKDAIAEGWAVPGWADPAEWPARRWVRNKVTGILQPVWVLYLDAPKNGEWWRVITDMEAARRMEGMC